MKRNKASLWLTTLVVLAGCPGPEEKLGTVTVTCAPASVVAGQPSQCTASATNQDGEPMTVPGYTWTSSDESMARVDAMGKVTTLTAGTPAIRASATVDGVTKEGQATLTVTPQLGGVTVSCAPTDLEVGQSAQCTASATDVSGQPITPAGYTWTSSEASVAQVDSTGKVTALSAGTPAIRASATWGGSTKEGQATLTIIQPTVHDTSITASETWLAANNPHVLRGALEVLSNATLTIEAGVELRFEQDAELRVTTGVLRALGTQEAPIRMVARQLVPTKGYWRGVVLASSGSASELNHVTLSHCGNASGKGACLALETQAAPVLRHVSVRDSGSAGVLVADDGSAFGAESTALSVSRSEGYAVRIGANQAGTIPSGSSFTDNTLQAIELRGSLLTRTQTWQNLDIPYVVNDFVNIEDATNKPTLTIAAGTVLRFGPLDGLRAGFRAEGTLIVDGTPEAPVLFTADSANPQPGHWLGVIVEEHCGNTRFSHVTFEYGGGNSTERSANLQVHGLTARPVINNVMSRKSALHGVYLDETDGGAAFGSGSTALSAHDNGGYAIAVAPNHVGSIPTGGTFSGNAHNAVKLLPSHVTTTQTWPDLGIPYVLNHFLNVGAADIRPMLTLLPGTQVRFGPQGGIAIGANGLPGKLWVNATHDKRVYFIPDSLTPTKGAWRGIHIWDAADGVLQYAVVTHAGAGGLGASVGTGNLNVYKKTTTYVVNNQFNDSSGCGVTRSDGTRTGTDAVTEDFTLTNNFSNNDGGEQCTN